jgi:hypothetical protein
MAKAQNDEAGRTARLSLPLTADGLVDWEHVRDSTAEKFLNIIKTDPEVRSAYMGAAGESPASDTPIFEEITEESVSKGLDTIQAANATIFRILAARFIKHPLLKDGNTGKPLPLVLDQQTLDSTFKFTEKQHAELDPRATRLAKKYSTELPDWLKKNLDLYMFASMFLAYTAENAKNAMGVQISRDLKRAQMQFAQRQANQPKNPRPDSDVSEVPPPPAPPAVSTEAEHTNGKAERNKEIVDPIIEMLKNEHPPDQPTV